MATFEVATRADRNEIIDFINMVFSFAHRPHDFKALIPKAYGDDASLWAEHYVAREAGRIRGLVAMLPFEQTVAGEKLSYGLVGSVSAHPYNKGAGYMKGCMSLMLEDSEKRGMDALYLSGQRQRYNYFGFENGGAQRTFTYNASNERHALKDVDIAGISVKPLGDYAKEAYALYADKTDVGGGRSAGAFAQILETWSSLAWAILSDGEFIGYAVSSADRGAISELELSDISALLRALKALRTEAGANKLSVACQPWETKKTAILARFCEGCGIHSGGMFNVLNPVKFMYAWLKLKSETEKLADGELTLSIDGEAITTEVHDNRVNVYKSEKAPDMALNKLEAVNLLSCATRYVDISALPLCARDWFPLPVGVRSVDGF